MGAKASAEKAAEEQKAKAAAAKEAESEAQEESELFNNMHERIHASKCENNAACAAANLTGYCCPTLNGISLNGTMLRCCTIEGPTFALKPRKASALVSGVACKGHICM